MRCGPIVLALLLAITGVEGLFSYRIEDQKLTLMVGTIRTFKFDGRAGGWIDGCRPSQARVAAGYDITL